MSAPILILEIKIFFGFCRFFYQVGFEQGKFDEVWVQRWYFLLQTYLFEVIQWDLVRIQGEFLQDVLYSFYLRKKLIKFILILPMTWKSVDFLLNNALSNSNVEGTRKVCWKKNNFVEKFNRSSHKLLF